MITKLDLGDTKHHFGNPTGEGWVAIDFTVRPFDKIKVCADWNHMPFPDETFGFAYGGCNLEDWNDPLPDYKELYRVMKKGGLVELSSCGLDQEFLDAELARIEEAGFRVINPGTIVDAYHYFEDLNDDAKDDDDEEDDDDDDTMMCLLDDTVLILKEV